MNDVYEEFDFTVRSYECCANGKVSVANLCNYLQESASPTASGRSGDVVEAKSVPRVRPTWQSCAIQHSNAADRIFAYKSSSTVGLSPLACIS